MSLPTFTCDIQDVDSIAASKSSAAFFATVPAFGKSFAEFRGECISHQALNAMLAHGEVRILRANGGDKFSVDAWDGRLFLANHGGSHHFAGAAYLALRFAATWT